MKKTLLILMSVLAAVVLAFLIYLKFVMPNVGSAPDLTIEATPERLVRGEYLATAVMACVDCHSQRDFSKYTAPLMGDKFAGGGPEFTVETGAPGNFFAPNLTPYHLKDWTDGEIYRAITAGVSKDGRALFPGMPYHLYGKVSDEDIYSVIAYLRTLPEVKSEVPAPEAQFPFSLILNTLPVKGEPSQVPDKSDKVKYGKYMINMAACTHCHTPAEKGEYISEMAYAGGFEFITPNGIVRSANITPDKETGIGEWTEDTFVDYFKAYGDSAFQPYEVGSGFNTVMPWTQYSKMSEEDLRAIYAYLTSLQPIKNEVLNFTPNVKMSAQN